MLGRDSVWYSDQVFRVLVGASQRMKCQGEHQINRFLLQALWPRFHGSQSASNIQSETSLFRLTSEITDMINVNALSDLKARLEKLPRVSLTLLPTPIHPLSRFAQSLGGPELWMKRDDLSGLEGVVTRLPSLNTSLAKRSARGLICWRLWARFNRIK